MIEARLTDALRQQLTERTGADAGSALSAFIDTVPLPKVRRVEQQSLAALLRELLAGAKTPDPTLKREVDAAVERLSEETPIGKLLGLEDPLAAHPFFEDVVAISRFDLLLKASDIGADDEKRGDAVKVFARHRSTGRAFLQTLRRRRSINATDIRGLKRFLDLASIANADPKLIRALRERNCDTAADLVPVRAADWIEILRSARVEPPDFIKEGAKREGRANESVAQLCARYAAHLEEQVRIRFPSAVFIDQLGDADAEDHRTAVQDLQLLITNNPNWELTKQPSYRGVNWGRLGSRRRNAIKQSVGRINNLLRRYPGLGLKEALENRKSSASSKVTLIRRGFRNLSRFYQNNPDLDLRTADFTGGYVARPAGAKTPEIKIGWAGINANHRGAVLAQMKTYQRLYRIDARGGIAAQLLNDGYDSAMKIVANSETTFVDSFTGDIGVANAIYKNACTIVSNTLLVGMNIRALTGESNFKGAVFDNVMDSLVDYIRRIPGYRELIGLPTFCACKDCRSIFSPAAYFVDLMGFIDTQVTQRNTIVPERSLRQRRPDLWQISLDCENTNQLIPYLDVVNEILERNVNADVSADPYEYVYEQAQHPFNLPVHIHLERARAYLAHFKVGLLGEVYEAFESGADVIAMERLGMSPREFELITTSRINAAALRSAYGIDAGGSLVGPGPRGLQRVEVFLKSTGLTRLQLNELVYQNLDEDERIILPGPVIATVNQRNRFYVNDVRDGPGGGSALGAIGVELDDNDSNDIHEVITNLTTNKLDRIHRFVRLATRLKWSFAELDWALRSIAKTAHDEDIDPDAIRKLWRMKQWQERLGLAVDELVGFWFDVKWIGRANPDGAEPADLFNRVFNDAKVTEGGTPLQPFSLLPQSLGASDPSDQFRNKLLAALEIGDEDLDRILTAIPTNPLPLNIGNLSFLYRLAKLPAQLRMTVRGFLDLLQLLGVAVDGADPQAAINSHLGNFDSFGETLDIIDWMRLSGFDVNVLRFFQTNELNPFVDPGYHSDDLRLMLEELSSHPTVEMRAFTVIDNVDEAQSATVFDQLVINGFIGKVYPTDTFGRLTPDYTPDAANFSIGLAAPFDTPAAQDKIIELLRTYDARLLEDEQRRNRILNGLGTLLGVDTDTLEALIGFTDEQLSDVRMTQLTTLIGEDDAGYAEIQLFVTKIYARKLLIDRLDLSREELAAIASNKIPFELGALDVLTLNEVRNLWRYRQLVREFRVEDLSLLEHLSAAQPDDASLAGVADWPEDQVASVAAEIAANRGVASAELYSSTTGLEQIARCFAIIRLLRVHADAVIAWSQWPTQSWDEQEAIAESILEIFKAKYGAEEWRAKFGPVEDRVREYKRDALVSWLTWHLRGNAIGNAEDLYQYLLIDVNMSSCQKVSRVKEGLNALQLFLHRCMMNLEQDVAPEFIPRGQWEWMKNYRVWEANRKVFLYPENYIEPELRDDKTTLFQELEEDLLQADVTDNAVRDAFTGYLDKFAELANLRITGACYHEGPRFLFNLDLALRTSLNNGTVSNALTEAFRQQRLNLSVGATVAVDSVDERWLLNDQGRVFLINARRNQLNVADNGVTRQVLYLVARTKTAPFTYFLSRLIDQIHWTEWEKIDLKIQSNYAIPIFSFNRLFLFWRQPAPRSSTTISGGSATTTDSVVWQINYSFMNLANKWVAPQQMDAKKTSFGDTDRMRLLFPQNMESENDGEAIRLYYYPKGSTSTYTELYKEFEEAQDDLDHIAFHYTGLSGKILKIDRTPRGTPNKLSEVTVKYLSENNYYFNATDSLFDGLVILDTPSSLLNNPVRSQDLLGDISESRPEVIIVNNNPEMFVFDNRDEQHLVTRSYDPAIGENVYAFERLSTYVVHALFQKMVVGENVESLMNLDSQRTPELPFDRLGPATAVVRPPADERSDTDGKFGKYYRELFLHIPLLVANRLNQNQQFEEAQRWYHFILNPFSDEPKTVGVSPLDRYWSYLPFRDKQLPTFEQMLSNVEAIHTYHTNPFKPDAIARLREGAYQKNVVMKYIDNLIDWAEFKFAQDTWESITEATMLYVTAYQLLGARRPEELTPCDVPETRTYEELEQLFGSGSAIPEFWIEVENAIPLAPRSVLTSPLNPARPELGERLGELLPQGTQGPSLLYFCFHENDRLRDYWKRVDDGLIKIRHCLDISGTRRELELYQPPLDPMALVRAVAGGRSLGAVVADLARPLPHYRFRYLLDRARSLTAQVEQLGSALLSALEKKDAEALTLLRATQESVIIDRTKSIRKKQRDEAAENMAALNQSKTNALDRKDHYEGLIRNKLLQREQAQLNAMRSARDFEATGNIMSTVASFLHLIPQIGAPTAMTFGGRELGSAMSMIAAGLKNSAAEQNFLGSMSSILGGYERRGQDWRLQRDTANNEIAQIDKQIDAARTRVAIAEAEIELQEKNIEHNEELHSFYTDKFSSVQLYQWMSAHLKSIHYTLYKMANDLAKSVERAYQYETNTTDTFISFGHWDTLKEGLLAGERLNLELRQIEVTYIENNRRSLEIEKTVSLAQLEDIQVPDSTYANALLTLKHTGRCEFRLSEEMFDFDFPGHYARQIKSIAVTIPALAGPYQNVNATLSQLSNRTLLQPDPLGVAYLLDENNVAAQTGRGAVRVDWRAREQIAISRGINDTGTFELNFNDDRYLPFEGTGAVSTWRLEMPRSSNRFNLDTVSDVIFNIRYTAVNGGDQFRNDVLAALNARGFQYSGFRMASLKNEHATEWHRFLNPPQGQLFHELRFTIDSDVFPANLANHALTRVIARADIATVNIGTLRWQISLDPGSAKQIVLDFDGTDVLHHELAGGDGLGEWLLRVDRSSIPTELRVQNSDGTEAVENIGGKPHYRLNRDELRNVTLAIEFAADIVF